ncbi:TBCC domain-containing protein 1-like isoform X1 [Durio zibethinus]|uniref:TBCC domain-containing protein 1 n=1 Tax=Durio zibethinus TaxID=66656 RepID=A0A6P5YQ47_DURZI|nr:TBCC domain-containing protein 1-like isoform X1 [Durio zibethinus]
MTDPIEPSTSTSDLNPNPIPTTFLHPRREPFEHGLLPIQKLIFTDPVQALTPLKQKLASSSTHRVDSAALAEALQISSDHARLVLDTLASVLHSESDPLVTASPNDVDSVGADLRDLILFLYIQSYKRLLPRSHKDSVAVADVWPSTSAFDGYLSALSPLQLVRSNSRRFMPSQADEEVHQLSYLQKHLANIVSLLSEPVEGEGEESLVLTVEGFEHLGFLIQFGDKGSELVPLSQAAPFFANSDPDMPAVPVPASQVHDWLLQNIASSLEHVTERISAKENGPPSGSDQDVAMADASPSSTKALPSARNPCFIEGVSKSSYVKQASDLKNSSVKVINCHDSVIYILAPLRYATIYGCSDATIVLGAVGKAVRVEHCERVHVIIAAKRVCIANCRECLFFLGVNQRPLIVGDNHKLQVAPYNTYYSQLEEHMTEVGIEATINRWDETLALGVIDPHDSLSHPAGVSDAQAELATRLDPDQFTNFLIPTWFEGESIGSTKDNPFPLPDAYMTSQQRKLKNLGEIKQILRETPLEENRKRELSCALHVYFKDWLYASGNIRQLYCLQVPRSFLQVQQAVENQPFLVWNGSTILWIGSCAQNAIRYTFANLNVIFFG